jgi:hypothetical protein
MSIDRHSASAPVCLSSHKNGHKKIAGLRRTTTPGSERSNPLFDRKKPRKLRLS